MEKDTPEQSKSGEQPSEVPEEEWHELWAISRSRFCKAWQGSNSRWVPDRPTQSLLKAVSLYFTKLLPLPSVIEASHI